MSFTVLSAAVLLGLAPLEVRQQEMSPMVHQVQLAPPTPGVPRNTSPSRSTPRRPVRVPQAVVAPAPAPTPANPSAPQVPYQEQYTWFWDKVSREYDAANPARLAKVEAVIANPPAGAKAISKPSASTLSRIAKDHNAALQDAYLKYDVSPAYLISLIWAESAGNPKAISSAGAGGLMQLMPGTADRFQVKDRFDPKDSIRGGAEYLFVLLTLFRQDPLLALAGYNAGENAVISYDGIPPFRETRDYVPKVMAAWTVAKTLCVTPPAAVTDGCVFRS